MVGRRIGPWPLQLTRQQAMQPHAHAGLTPTHMFGTDASCATLSLPEDRAAPAPLPLPLSCVALPPRSEVAAAVRAA